MLKEFLLLDLYILSLLNTELRKSVSHFCIHLSQSEQGPSKFIDLQGVMRPVGKASIVPGSREHGGSNGTIILKPLHCNVELFINTTSLRMSRSIVRFSYILH